MEANTLKKILLYSAVAVFLGLLLTLSPLIIVTEIKTEDYYGLLPEQMRPEQQEKLKEIYGLGAPKYSIADFEVLLTSFAIASGVYMFFKRRMPGS
jgi:hypothetical protein